MPEAEAVRVEKHEVVRAMFRDFDYAQGLAGTPQQRLAALATAMDWVLRMQERDAARETGEEAKKRARRRFDDAVLALSKAFALASASDTAQRLREEVGFFQTVRVALAKRSAAKGIGASAREAAIQQIVSRAVVSTAIIDVLAAAGMKAQDISILSDEFLAEIRGMERKNLALEALRRLVNDEIRSPARRNVVETRAFSERLEAAIRRYHNNAITTAEVIEELIRLGQGHGRGAASRRGAGTIP